MKLRLLAVLYFVFLSLAAVAQEKLLQSGPMLGFEVKAMESVVLDGERVSSTAVRNALAQGDLTRAEALELAGSVE